MVPQIKDKEMLGTFLADFLKFTVPEVLMTLEKGNHAPVVNDQKVVEGMVPFMIGLE